MPLDFEKLNDLLRQKCDALSITPTPKWIYVSIAAQKLWLLEGSRVRLESVCSSSKHPPSCRANSLGTPTGLHAIGDKIGTDAPLGAVFKGRVCIADHFSQLAPEEQAKNLITTRILRLRGLDPAANARAGDNAWERYIYIHGTNHPERLGQPFSAGCILLGDAALVAFYRAIAKGDLVWIEAR